MSWEADEAERRLAVVIFLAVERIKAPWDFAKATGSNGWAPAVLDVKNTFYVVRPADPEMDPRPVILAVNSLSSFASDQFFGG